MHLQNFLHLPSTRQRNDGHHENQFEVFASPVIFPTHELKAASSYQDRFFKTAVLACALFASFATSQVLSPQVAQAKPTIEKPVGTWGHTTAAAAYIRIRPGVQTPIVAKIPRGMQVMVWGTYDGWYRVETTDHKFGWMHNENVSVPRAEKLKELSHTKARQASDRTGNQTLYGKPSQLKKYYAAYKAPGAAKGLKKQGISLASAPKAVPAKTKLVKATIKAPASRPIIHSVAAPRQPQLPCVISITTAEPQKVVARKVVAAKPVVQKLPVRKEVILVAPKVEETRAVKPVVATITRPPVKPVQATVRIVRQKVEQVEATFNVSASGGKQQITAADIMTARANYLRNQPTSRHKTRPNQGKSSPSSVIKTAPSGKPIAPRIQPMSSRGNSNAINAMPKSIYAQVKVAPQARSTPSRGGSPRDYARYAAANNKFGDGMASQALTYRGMPYISGASSPSRGFDCSGLVYYLLRTRGYNPPRTAAGFASYGTGVSRNELKPGDLVLFANTYKRGVSHIGIYTGNNNFVHAANSHSGVKTDSLNSAYYSKKYYSARRVTSK